MTSLTAAYSPRGCASATKKDIVPGHRRAPPAVRPNGLQDQQEHAVMEEQERLVTSGGCGHMRTRMTSKNWPDAASSTDSRPRVWPT